MNSLDFTGQTLDGKYQMTRELGRGGMGTVYLATHLGTERPVAVKIISPQFMQRAEFVERFRREARAAGRLRHPNVVDVTDFGFADSSGGQVAYLVMEYLDGCTLGEILDEEKNLPVSWTLDILEQVCSAVQEAHEQGIIHRDLKPDNIWLEPNQRGGYTVKVLDFGIAKLEEHDVAVNEQDGPFRNAAAPTRLGQSNTTFGGDLSTLAAQASTIVQGSESGTMVSDGGTVQIQAVDSAENKTAIFNPVIGDQDTVGTQVLANEPDAEPVHSDSHTVNNSLTDSRNSAGLTRVGAVLGTPLYMSPEQCRGEHLDPRSDIYSLGVIAYQMLSGDTPFSGDFKDVMESHKSTEPPQLVAKKVRRKMKRAIHLALSKNPDHRPQTAEGFASVLRSRSEGLGALLRRATVIYSEHLPKFVMLTTFFMLPVITLTLTMSVLAFLKASDVLDRSTANILIGITAIALTLASAFCTYLNNGAITWLVTHYLAMPLRPLRLRPVLAEVRKKWKTFAGTGLMSTLLVFLIGIITCGIGLIVLSIVWTLVAPVVMMENLRGRAALKRSKELVKRSISTSTGAVLIMFLMPALIAGTISLVVNLSASGIENKVTTAQAAAGQPKNASSSVPAQDPSPVVAPVIEVNDRKTPISVTVSDDVAKGERKDMRTRVKETLTETLSQLIWLPIQILVLSFSAIIIALLYLKTRLAGGESMHDLIERFEDDEKPRKKWQERVRQRLIQSGRLTSKS